MGSQIKVEAVEVDPSTGRKPRTSLVIPPRRARISFAGGGGGGGGSEGGGGDNGGGPPAPSQVLDPSGSFSLLRAVCLDHYLTYDAVCKILDLYGDDSESRLAALGEAVQLDPINPTLKSPGTRRLKLKCDKLLSILLQFCFQNQLLPLHLGIVWTRITNRSYTTVRRCRLTPR